MKTNLSKKICALCAVLISAGFLFARPVMGVNGFFGEAWGTTFNSVSGTLSGTPFADNMVFGAGFSLRFSINEWFSIQGEADLTRNSAGYKASIDELTEFGVTKGGTYTSAWKYYSLDTPVFAVFDFNRVRLMAGLYASFPENLFLGIKRSGTYAYTSSSGENVEKSYERNAVLADWILFGASAGVSFRIFESGSKSFFVNLRYINDFTAMKDTFTRRALLASVSLEF